MEKLKPGRFPKNAKTARVQKELEDLILEADSLVNNLEEDVAAEAAPQKMPPGSSLP